MRGGKRDGAGRKPEWGSRKIHRSVSLTPSVWRYLAAQDGSINQAIEAVIRRTVGFKRWENDNADD